MKIAINDEAFHARYSNLDTKITRRLSCRDEAARPSHAGNWVQVVVVAPVSLVFGLERRGGAGGVSIHFMFDITRLAVNDTIDLHLLHHLLLQEATVPGRGSLTAGHAGSSPGANTLLPDWRGGALALSAAAPAGCRGLVRPGGAHGRRHGGEDWDVGLLGVPRRRARRTVSFRLKFESQSSLGNVLLRSFIVMASTLNKTIRGSLVRRESDEVREEVLTAE